MALQTWLQLAGVHDVAIPFSPALAALVPATLVRMMRDFRQLLTVVQAIALLYQCQRDRDENGWIVATLDDYRWARELLLSAFTQAATGGVSPEVREVVTAVAALHKEKGSSVTKKQVADRVGLSTSGAWYRLTKALDLGYLVNLETRNRQPAKLIPGDPLPEDRPALPTVAEVERYMEGYTPSENDRIVESAGTDDPQSAGDSAVAAMDSIAPVTALETVTWESDSLPLPSEVPIQRFNDLAGGLPPLTTAQWPPGAVPDEDVEWETL